MTPLTPCPPPASYRYHYLCPSALAPALPLPLPRALPRSCRLPRTSARPPPLPLPRPLFGPPGSSDPAAPALPLPLPRTSARPPPLPLPRPLFGPPGSSDPAAPALPLTATSSSGPPLLLPPCLCRSSAPWHGRHLCLCRVHSLAHPVALTLPLPPCLLPLPRALALRSCSRLASAAPPHLGTAATCASAAFTHWPTRQTRRSRPGADLPLPSSFKRTAGPRRYRVCPRHVAGRSRGGRPQKHTSLSVARSFHGKGPSAEQAIVRRCARVWRWVPDPGRRACRR
jgi:hypothetical protein